MLETKDIVAMAEGAAGRVGLVPAAYWLMYALVSVVRHTISI